MSVPSSPQEPRCESCGRSGVPVAVLDLRDGKEPFVVCQGCAWPSDGVQLALFDVEEGR